MGTAVVWSAETNGGTAAQARVSATRAAPGANFLKSIVLSPCSVNYENIITHPPARVKIHRRAETSFLNKTKGH
jgi:hypothetical protein